MIRRACFCLLLSTVLFSNGASAEAAQLATPRSGPGEALEELVQWLDELVHRIDVLGIIQSPWERLETPANSALGRSSGSRSRVESLRLEVKVKGDGYGLVAQVRF